MSHALLAQTRPAAQRGEINLFTPAEQQELPFAQGASAPTNNAFGNFLSMIFRGVIVIGLMAVLIFLIWGAIEWISAGGEKGKVDSARQKITGAIVGLIVLASSIALFMFVQSVIGIKILTF